MNSAVLLGVATLCLPIGLSVPPAASALQIVAPASSVQVTPAELEDLRTIAADEGISLDEAVARYGWQGEFGRALEEASARFPTTFAGSNMDTDPTDGTVGGVVRFVGEVPDEAAKLFAHLSVPVELDGGSAVSTQDVARAVSAAHYAAREAATAKSITTEFDEIRGVIISELGQTGLLTATATAKLRSTMEQAMRVAVDNLGPRFTSLDVEAISTDELVGDGDTIRGGAILTWPGSSSLACTSGWSATRTDTGSKGLITADHCSNDMDYSGRDVLTYSKRIGSSYGDIQYMTSTEAIAGEFYYGVGEYRDVTARGTPFVDDYLCKFGRTSEKTCDHVRDTSTCRDDYCNLVSMDNREAAPGDSGGPWFYGKTAYGVHSGYHTSFFQKRDQFTPLHNTLANFDLKLWYS